MNSEGDSGSGNDLVGPDATMLRDLRTAVSTGTLTVAYQPQFDIESRSTVGPVAVEALCRWNHPSLGSISPELFIPVAERSGLIAEIGATVLAQSAAQVSAWQRGGHPMSLSINASATEISLEYAAATVVNARRMGLTPGSLTVEITESPPLQFLPVIVESLTMLRSAGVAVSIDDFGAGSLTLAILERMPIDEIKIDRSLTQRTDAGADHTIAQVMARADDLGWRVIAEGIETEADLERALRRGCRRGQGFLWGMPVPASEFEDFLR